ncbi:MAG: hypothetical protein ACTHKZ_02360 [Lysobacteraceae bacterium]
MPRFPVRLLLAVALAAAIGGVCAQDFAIAWNPRSGDAWVDAQLADINHYGLRYRDPFIDELARYQGAPRDLVGELLQRQWAPGDIYFACALAQLSGRPCRYVAGLWERDHAQGWGAIAQRLGIAPGSPAFHRLKRGLVPSFDRWGRPIALDASLAADFPGRGVAGSRERAAPARGRPADGREHGTGHGEGREPGKDDGHGHGNSHGDGRGHGGHGHG